MKRNLFSLWLVIIAILFSISTQAQMTVGGKKAPEPFSVLELLNKGGLRLPQMTTLRRNAFAVQNKVQGEGLTIYNIDTKCVEYWNKVRWVSLCEGTSQITISPEPCINVPADASGCNNTFTVTDPGCPSGPFNISIVAGSEYAYLTNVDNTNGTFKIAFRPNETVNQRTVLVRVKSNCSNLFKDFLFSQNGVDCSSAYYATPNITPSSSTLYLCVGGAVYLSVPSSTPNLDKLIWTRNGIEVARGVSYYVATQKGVYNISMGAVGCNTQSSNERNVVESGTVIPVNLSAVASNNGIICGPNSVTLTAFGANPSGIVWFHNGVEERSGSPIAISGASSVGEWFAVTKSGSCYSRPSNSVMITKSQATGQVSLPASDVLVNGKQLNSYSSFCGGASLDLSIANKINNVTYTWYNGTDVIYTNPFIVPTYQTKLSLRLVATDNTGTSCPAEASALDKNITTGNAPTQPTITSTTNGTICDGNATLKLEPAVAGNYTYIWYQDGVKMSQTSQEITVSTPGAVYSGSVTNDTGCTSPLAVAFTIPATVSSKPVLTWGYKPTSANYGTTVTVQTNINFGPASSYTWTVDKGSIIGSGASIAIALPPSGTDGANLNVKVIAKNNCGNSAELTGEIVMNSVCPIPIVEAQSLTTQNITVGSSASVSVSVSNGVSQTYQWYSNTSASTSGATPIGFSNSPSYSYTPPQTAGTYYLYCVVTNNCGSNPSGASPIFTINSTVSPAGIPSGTGSLIGRTCFDIAETEGGATCGSLSSRATNKADFNKPGINTQTYTFTPSGTVSKVRFAYVESIKGIVTSFNPVVDKSQTLNISTPVTATLVYSTSLSTGSQGAGKAKGNAFTVDIYVIYNDNANGTGTDKTVKLTAQIKDCVCCGAFVGPLDWREFMCHNLGANTATPLFRRHLVWLEIIINGGEKPWICD
ncbi:hypothetical protein ACQ9BO_24470 [Flavobacterium sp. P21]|uniref:hypothetical protein n=1 Tax=Flavobacterium sp. P21 TaxID=3423948 RepID=UPI003D67D53D